MASGAIACVDLNGFVLGVTAFAPTHQITQSGSGYSLVTGGTLYPPLLEYCSYDGNYYVLNWPNNSTLYKLTVPGTLTGTWVWSSESLTPKSGTSGVAFESPARGDDNGLYSRFRYVAAIKSFVWSDGHDLKVQAGRPSNFT